MAARMKLLLAEDRVAAEAGVDVEVDERRRGSALRPRSRSRSVGRAQVGRRRGDRHDVLTRLLRKVPKCSSARPVPTATQFERVLRHVARDAGDLGEERVEVAQQRAAAGHDHPLVDDVARQLGRRLLEHVAHRGHDLLERLLDRLGDLGRGDRDRARQAGDHVAALDLHRQRLVERQRGADLDLHLLGRALADHEVVLAPDVVGDRLVEPVAADAHAVATRRCRPAR